MVTSKLQTVAIRFPSHPIIKKILKELKFPLAMPSANKSSSISPVCAKDVAEEFKNKLKIIFSLSLLCDFLILKVCFIIREIHPSLSFKYCFFF